MHNRVTEFFDDLEHFDEPSPEDAAELDERVRQHLAALYSELDGRFPGVPVIGSADYGVWSSHSSERDDDDDDEPDDQLADDDRSTEDEDDDEPGAEEPVIIPPIPATPGPLAGRLDQLILPFSSGPFGATSRGRRGSARPGDVPGWKGVGDA